MMDQHICLIVHNIRSLWNVGSIFRTADGIGVEKIYLTGYTGVPPRKEITKTALGAEDFVEWEHVEDPMEVVQDLKEKEYEILSLEQTENSIPIEKHKAQSSFCLILGNEIAGVREDLLAESDAILEIPMLGQKESFNVAVAAGIALYALRAC